MTTAAAVTSTIIGDNKQSTLEVQAVILHLAHRPLNCRCTTCQLFLDQRTRHCDHII
jgi:hypothetical protein